MISGNCASDSHFSLSLKAYLSTSTHTVLQRKDLSTLKRRFLATLLSQNCHFRLLPLQIAVSNFQFLTSQPINIYCDRVVRLGRQVALQALLSSLDLTVTFCYTPDAQNLTDAVRV